MVYAVLFYPIQCRYLLDRTVPYKIRKKARVYICLASLSEKFICGEGFHAKNGEGGGGGLGGEVLSAIIGCEGYFIFRL